MVDTPTAASTASRAWWLYLVGAGLLAFAYLLGPPLLHSGPVYNLIGLSGAAAILVGTRINRPSDARPWYLFALAQSLFVTGDVLAYNYQRLFGSQLPFPSVADVFYLAVYPVLIAGLLILIRQRNRGRDTASLIDSLIITIGLAVLSWIFLMAPYAHDATLSTPTKLTSIAYPLMDVLVLGVAVRLAVGEGRRGTSFYLMIGAIVALLVTDAIYGWFLLNGGYETGGWLDGGWIVFYMLWGAAALHPSMRTVSQTSTRTQRLSAVRLAALGIAALTAPIVQIVQVSGAGADEIIVAAAGMILFLLVMARMVGLVTTQERAARRERTLRKAGAALVTATGEESILEAAHVAASKLAGPNVVVRAWRVEDREGTPTVIPPAGGAHPAPLSRLPGPAFAALLLRKSVDVPGVVGLADIPAGQPVFLVPLFVRDELRGLIAASASAPLPGAVRSGIETLAYQVALALESATLTEELVRNKSEARFGSLVQNSSDVVLVIDPSTTIHYVSPSIERVLGYEAADVMETRAAELVHPDDRAGALHAISAVAGAAEGASELVEFRIRSAAGDWLSAESLTSNLTHDENVGGIVLNVRDVSERKRFEAELARQAFHDSLTGLANRALFRDRVEHALARRRERSGSQVAVLFIDLDDFKNVNDSLGHVSGDVLLREVGTRVSGAIRAEDTAARLGGDEFAILLEDVEGGDRASEVAQRLLVTLAEPLLLDGKDMSVSASIGIAFAGEGEEAVGSEELLRNADVAMYTAKEHGKGTFQIFEQAMHASVVEQLELVADLQTAVQDDQLVLHYQPIFRIDTGEITGFEALVRWSHPVRGFVSPADFIPAAERSGLIVSIGRWVLETACREAVAVQRLGRGGEPLKVSVNLSARQLQRPDVEDHVRHALEVSGLDPALLVLEITESMLIDDWDLALERLENLRAIGVKIAVDDFGTGYSSLNYIRQLPVDILKIDKSFVDGLVESGSETALMAAIVDLASVLQLHPVAEGVEHESQLHRLRSMGCELGQGFLFSRPLPAAQLHALLQGDAFEQAA
ncbi:MAG TPA: EAL domain-containing protein [Solirubrobacteraceae bacterium]|nr:EAL domain-containing protein [Solirubrobacteraceae bacterium]